MTVTVGTGGAAASCAVAFNTAYTTAPSCVASSSGDTALTVATTKTTVTVAKASSLTAGSKLHIHCMGY